MRAIIYLLMITMFLYTVGFSISLWKEKNKAGSIFIFFLALIIAVAPFFTILN